VKSGFAAVVDAVKAIQAQDEPGLRAALIAAPDDRFFRKAVAHRCAGMIFTAVARYHAHDDSTLRLWRMLQGYAGNCALASQRMRRQVDGIVDAFAQDGVSYALLKGAARLRAGDADVQWTHMDDIDVLIPREQGEGAVQALRKRGYDFDCDVRAQRDYRTRHHHLAPLVPREGGKPVELHVQLEYPRWFSSRTDWTALGEHLLPDETASHGFRLDAFGRALHALTHGVGLYRLLDVAILAAELRRKPELLQQLEQWIPGERKQSIGIRAVLVLAARIAQLAVRSDERVERYLDWVLWREEAPPPFRGRLQVLDAYFSSAISVAAPGEVTGFTFARRFGVRIGLAVAAAGYRALVAR
jgi:hypothetical protein